MNDARACRGIFSPHFYLLAAMLMLMFIWNVKNNMVLGRNEMIRKGSSTKKREESVEVERNKTICTVNT